MSDYPPRTNWQLQEAEQEIDRLEKERDEAKRERDEALREFVDSYAYWRDTVAMIGGGRDSADRLAATDAAFAKARSLLERQS